MGSNAVETSTLAAAIQELLVLRTGQQAPEQENINNVLSAKAGQQVDQELVNESSDRTELRASAAPFTSGVWHDDTSKLTDAESSNKKAARKSKKQVPNADNPKSRLSRTSQLQAAAQWQAAQMGQLQQLRAAQLQAAQMGQLQQLQAAQFQAAQLAQVQASQAAQVQGAQVNRMQAARLAEWQAAQWQAAYQVSMAQAAWAANRT